MYEAEPARVLRIPRRLSCTGSTLKGVCIDITPAISRAAGELRAGRDTMGRRLAQADMLIAATALVHGLTLATRDVNDFDGCGVVLVDPFAG